MKAALYLIGALLAWWGFSALSSSHREDVRAACGPVPRAAIVVPADKPTDLAPLLSAAEKLQAQGLCVIEGGWGVQTQQFYLTVQQPGQAPTFRRFTPAELYDFAV
jgi:hypothetical protein